MSMTFLIMLLCVRDHGWSWTFHLISCGGFFSIDPVASPYRIRPETKRIRDAKRSAYPPGRRDHQIQDNRDDAG